MATGTVTCTVCELHAEAVFRVEGMDCNEEVVILERRLKPLAGLEALSADLIGQRLHVEFWLEHEEPMGGGSALERRWKLMVACGGLLGAAAVLDGLALARAALPLYLAGAAAGIVYPLRRAVTAARSHILDINVLMVIAGRVNIPQTMLPMSVQDLVVVRRQLRRLFAFDLLQRGIRVRRRQAVEDRLPHPFFQRRLEVSVSEQRVCALSEDGPGRDQALRFEKKWESTYSAMTPRSSSPRPPNSSPLPTRRSLHATFDSTSMSFLPIGIRNRTLTVIPFSSGLVVRTATPPRLMLSVTAAAIVLPNRYAIGMPRTTRGPVRRLTSPGNRCGASDGRMCCSDVYSFT